MEFVVVVMMWLEIMFGDMVVVVYFEFCCVLEKVLVEVECKLVEVLVKEKDVVGEVVEILCECILMYFD